jgi:flavin reductase (DIM6/NTAB) family NADH-FMN oxidoreductase RutF
MPMADDGAALRALRTALGQYPTGVAVATTCSPAGPVGVTINSFGSLSLDPPLVLWCLRRCSAGLAAFTGAEHFAVNVLAAGCVQSGC